jgi:hypothetical protein
VYATDEGSGYQCTAYGYQRALDDTEYTALWSDTNTSKWQPLTTVQSVNSTPNRFRFDTDNRLYFTTDPAATYINTTFGQLVYIAPNAGLREITHISFDYTAALANATWRYGIHGWGPIPINAAWTNTGSYVVNSGSASGSVTQALAAGTLAVGIWLQYNSATPTTGAQSDTHFLRITNVRVTTKATPVDVDDIAAHIATTLNALNPTHLQATAGLLQSPGLDLYNEVYEDRLPSDILTELCKRGDNGTTPRPWVWGVDSERRLFLQPAGYNGRSWYADIADFDLRRAEFYNSAYATYRAADGRTLRGATSTHAPSVSRYGITRRRSVASQSTSSLQADIERDAYLLDNREPLPRADITLSRLYTTGGARAPLAFVRPGDTITIRNLPAGVSTDIDRIRTFRLSRVEYAPEEPRITLVPEGGSNLLEFVLARRDNRR